MRTIIGELRNGSGNWRMAAVLVLLYALLYLSPLGTRPLHSPDEVRYGAIAHEMLESGDWISPRFNGVRYFEKPVLGHWLNSMSMAVFGKNAFALRLPVALATGLTALIVFAFTHRFATPGSWLAALIFLTTFIVAGSGTFASLDAFLALFLAGVMASYYCALRETCPWRRRGYLVLCGMSCAGALLAKGFLALAIPVVVVAPYIVVRRRWRAMIGSAWVPLAVTAALVLPWAVAIHLREPDFWRYFFWIEHIQRFMGENAQHAEPFWFYLLCLPVIGLPWILLLPAALTGLRGTGRHDRDLLAYLASWAIAPFVFLSLSKGKLPSYILPCFAPLSIVLAIGLLAYLAGKRRRAFNLGAGAVAIVFIAALIAIFLAQTGAFGQAPYGPGEMAKLAAFSGCMAAGAVCAICAALAQTPVARIAAVAGTSVALLFPLQVALPLPKVLVDNVFPVTVVARHPAPDPDTALVTDGSLFGTLAWHLKRDDIYVLDPGEIEYGLSYPESRHRWLDRAGLEHLIQAHRGDILVVCKSRNELRCGAWLPPSARRSQDGRIVFWRIPPSGASSR
jgi:4-amino-4-deoxy-L-arabinose transferase